MAFIRAFFRFCGGAALALALFPIPIRGQATGGAASFGEEQLIPGATVSLDGEWRYTPGYLLTSSDRPESEGNCSNCFPVSVPQLLNRVYWWLDDSEDFKKHEDERLKRLGFDTDKAEDGWYRLSFVTPELPKDRHLFVEFEGIAMRTKVFCNGQRLGEHEGMFSRFSFDLTPTLKVGTNLLAVFVSMEKIPPSTLSMGEAVTVNLTASKVRSLSKGMFGPLAPGYPNKAYDLHGIWQPVTFKVREAARLDDVWFSPSLDSAEVRIQASSLAAKGKAVKAVLKARWTEPKTGTVFAETEPETVRISSSSTATVWLRNVKPQLWTPATPNLYTLRVTLESEEGKVLDAWDENVGFRTFEIHGNQFYLNGKPYWLRGANHLPYGKNPWDKELPRKLVQLMHDSNVRITRTHATPWNEAWLDAADEIGLAVSVEGIRPWGLAGKIGATPPELFQHWLSENEDVIKRLRNHPSVFIYTVGNEMMLRDTKNLEKWKQLSAVVKQTRRLDPTRPVIASSEYQREPELFRELLQPNGLDDGDIDDIHRYNNWYGPSSFVTNSLFEPEMKKRHWQRPFMGQEMSSGYPDLDTGLPVLRYTRDLLTPQAWVGEHAYPGSDPAIFLAHDAAVTKRWAEQLRYQRGTNTPGFMLFAAECWASHSFDSATLKPYPTFDAIKQAWAPIGIAIESGRRRFYAGQELETVVYISNDMDDFSDLGGCVLEAQFDDGARQKLGAIAALPYRATTNLAVRLKLPEKVSAREKHVLKLHLVRGGDDVSRTLQQQSAAEPARELVEIFQKPAEQRKLQVVCVVQKVAAAVKSLADSQFQNVMERIPSDYMGSNMVVFLGSGSDLKELGSGQLRYTIEQGATAVVFSPGEQIVKLFPRDLIDAKAGPIEFADFAPVTGTKLAEGLEPMDLKWWGRQNDWRVFIGSQSHRLKPDGEARLLLRYIPPHSYISADKVPEQYRTVMFEIPIGKGRLWVCDLDFEQTIEVDPLARKFAENLCQAAADKESTSHLPKLLSHEELLNRVAK